MITYRFRVSRTQLAVLLACGLASFAKAEVRLRVTEEVLQKADQVMPFGAGGFGDPGAFSYSADNFVLNPGNEPVVFRKHWRVAKVGDSWIEVDRGGASEADRWRSGFLSGASVRLYRLVDAEGRALPPDPARQDAYPDVSGADHVILLRKDKILPKGASGYPDGGYISDSYSAISGRELITACVFEDRLPRLPGERTYYAVTSVSTDGKESDYSEEVCVPSLARGDCEVDSRQETQPQVAAKAQPIAAPAALKASLSEGGARLEWSAPREGNIKGYRVWRSETPRQQQRERIYLQGGAAGLQPYDYVYIDHEVMSWEERSISPRLRTPGAQSVNWHWSPVDASVVEFSLEPHAAKLPEGFIDAGKSCLRVVAGAGPQRIYQPIFAGPGAKDESWFGQLEPGVSYRLDVWMRQEGLGADGEVRFGYTGGEDTYPSVGCSFKVSGEWKRYSYTFKASTRPRVAGVFGHAFAFTGPGTLWIDNARISRAVESAASEAYRPNPKLLAELLAAQPPTGRKGALRFFGAAFNHASMLGLAGFYPEAQLSSWDEKPTIIPSAPMTLAHAFEFARCTGDSPDNRMRPFVTMQQYFSEEEWLGFVEYIAAPYDPEKDSPLTKPYAYQRYRQRGNGTAWVDEFETIAIEIGNETWHNGALPDWQGYGPHRWITHNDPKYGVEYGCFAEYIYKVMASSPYWQARGLEKRIRLNLNGFYDGKVRPDGSVVGYGEVARQHAPSAYAVGHAVYVGAAQWETGIQNRRDVYDADGVLAAYIAFQANPDGLRLRQEQAAARDALRARGLPCEITAYEGGPSGSGMLPGQESPEARSAYQKYRHSKALGVAVLDAWLACTKLGWRDMMYLGYGQGEYVNSHLPFAWGFRPKPAWTALAMRNRFASGDMLETKDLDAPCLALGERQIPLVGSYAFRDGNKYSVFVLSRKVPGLRGGVDYGDGFTPVVLELPFRSASKIVLHRLGGDVLATNKDELQVSLESVELSPAVIDAGSGTMRVDPASGGGAGGLPPGSAFLYVFENTEGASPVTAGR